MHRKAFIYIILGLNMDFKRIIVEQVEEFNQMKSFEKIIDRDKILKAKEMLRYPNIFVIVGIRRSGKSVFSYLLAEGKKAGYINFDDERLFDMRVEDFDKIMEAFYELYGDVEYVILDEVQNVVGWELFANRLRRSKKVILTGSNSKLLSGELSTHLTGRYIDITLFPFSFVEYLKFKDFKLKKAYTSKEKGLLMKSLRDYLERGGFPEGYKFGKVMISKIYDDIISKDILLRYRINKIDELKKLARYLVANSAMEISYRKLGNILGINRVETISNWMNYLEEAFLIFRVDKFDYKLKQQFVSPKKVYCVDSGIMNNIGFKFSENIGKVMENEVFLDLKRRVFLEDVYDVFYWKNYSQHEVDFVVKKGERVERLIQVSYISSRENINDREIRSLILGSLALRCEDLIVVTWDYEEKREVDGKIIKFIPLWKWLMRDFD